MEQEFDNIRQENNGAENVSRDGYNRPAFSREYSSEGRPQRQRIRTQRPAYGTDRPRFNSGREEGGFRPEGFGTSLRQDNAERGDYRQSYGQRPRYNAGGYGQRPRAAIVQDTIMTLKAIITVSRDSVRVIMQRARMHLSRKALTAVAIASRAVITVAAITVAAIISRVVLIAVAMDSRAAITVVAMDSSVAHMASRAAISAVSIHRATILMRSIVTRSELNIARQI